ncbi:exonuclease mut-7 homolog isoform X1 [Vespa mandarinia]|uniref:exonuclease mut-7 homolog isoform X1 n=2 Tax=Vespa mandarinia TaxID=7446 RepID=UPI00161FB622|nr:exonuclease mut-7 homolog isoform X1 [Vespa mandarinia]
MAQAMVGIENGSSHHMALYQKDIEEDLLFFTNIDEATKIWLNTLHDMWKLWKKCEGVTKTLFDYFDTAPNPYLSTLRILVNTIDFKHAKVGSSLAFTVIEEFSNWLVPRKDSYKECLVPDLKIAAFKLLNRQKNMQLIKMVSVTYDFIEHKELFLQMIQNIINEKRYKEAAQYATMLRLQMCYTDPEILLLPLILQNKLAVVEDFLFEYPNIQKILVTYLDNLVALGKNMDNKLEQYIETNNIPDVKIGTIQIRPMTKLIARFAKLYNLPPELCPNLNRRRNEGALQFLIHKRYGDGSLNTESWREMIREAVGHDIQLQLETVKSLSMVGETKEGLYWAKTFNIPKEQWPWAISFQAEQYSDEINVGASTSKEENWNHEDSSICYHTLKLPRDTIKLIDSPRLFEEFLDNGLRGIQIVGIDSEWKPTFGTKKTQLALIQIATETNVYILDVITIGNQHEHLWSEFNLLLFENKHILKLGFGIANDILMIRDYIPAISNIKVNGQGCIDVLFLWRKLVEGYNFQFPYKGDQNFTSESLSKLVELCLGSRLNKSDQFSNWEQRPLRESQIIYAALDAYCLLEIYTTLAQECEHTDIPFQDICAEIQHIPHRHFKKTPKKYLDRSNAKMQSTLTSEKNNFQNGSNSKQFKKVLQTYHNSSNRKNFTKQENKQKQYQLYPQNPSGPIPAHSWRAVCDSMLGGLASKLRMCGCDCLYVLFDKGGEQSAKLAVHENRILLTQRFTQYLPLENCYKVISSTPNEQLREVLSHFSVIVTQKDILSRCQFCNFDEFVEVPKTLMDELVRSFINITKHEFHNNELDQLLPASQYAEDLEEVNKIYFKDHFTKQNQNRTWHLSTGTLDVKTCTTKYHMRVQINKVPLNILRKILLFYVCEHCGYIYWDGIHLEQILNGAIQDLIIKE